MYYALKTLELFLYALEILILIRVLVSWIPRAYDNPFVQFIVQITDPILNPIKKLIEKSIFGGKGNVVDFSPLVAFLIISALQRFVMSLNI
ncbi:MAG: YggT family protein [Vallitalea sp.]|jgi:YggT family protein|nr:YggT family protein [Vallitalea sp.]